MLMFSCDSCVVWGQGFQVNGAPQAKAQEKPEDEMVINLSEKADLDLAALIQWLANEKQIRVTSNSDKFPGQRKNKVVFFGDVRVSPDAMLEIVQSILRTNGFALVKSDVKNLFQIVELVDVRPFAPILARDQIESAQKASYATVIFSLQHIQQAEAQNYLKQLLYGNANTGPASNMTGIVNRNTLIVTETVDRLSKIIELLEQIDVPPQTIIRQFYQVKNSQAQELQQQLNEILSTGGPTTSGSNSSTGPPAASAKQKLKINALSRTNQLLFSGTQEDVVDAMKLAKDIDVVNQLRLQTYQFRFTNAKRVDELIRQRLGGLNDEQKDNVYQATVNEQGNQLVVTTREEIHQQIQTLKLQLDVESADNDSQSPVKFYTLKNVKAIDILQTLLSITGQAAAGNFDGGQQRLGADDFGPQSLRGVSLNPNNVNNFAGGFGGGSPFGPVGGSFGGQQSGGFFGQGQPQSRFGGNVGRNSPGSGSGLRSPQNIPTPGRLPVGGIQGNGFQPPFGQTGQESGTSSNGIQQVIPGEARITIDENTNTLVVVAAPEVQKLYEDLIKKLDVRRPQVLVEIRVVTISAMDTYNLGVEVSGGDRIGDRQLFGLTSFGLSTVEAATGALTITPGLGFNGALVDPATADVVLQALAQHQGAEVVTAPRILVNDNATGLISSVAEVPFTSQSTSTAATATTSFGGFAQAGTTVSVTPQISEEDYLNLEFDVLINNFIGAASDPNIPPARNTDQVTSQISIPDGHTVIVGGLKRQREASNVSGIPFLERIPIINRLTSNTADEMEDQRLFVFIKPVILRDDKFRDLRFLSEAERQAAKLPADLPYSEPVLIR